MEGTGFVYRNPLAYRLLMRLLYGRSYRRHYFALIREIGKMNVLELCCGDCQIVDYFKDNSYRGLDINPVFVASAREKGLDVTISDIREGEIPEAECILIHNSLYQFYPDHEGLINKALASASGKVIISEPVINLASSQNKLIAFIANSLTRVNSKKGDSASKRFNRDEMETIFKHFNAEKVEFLGRNLMGVLSAS